jgi:hypothetical protein
MEVVSLRRPDLLLLIAIWEFISAFGVLIGISAIAVFAFPSVSGEIGAIFGLSIAVFVLVCYMAMAISGGIGLLMGKEWGRVIAIVHSVLSLFSIPFGTVIGALCLAYLLRKDVKDYFNRGPGM